ncbi:MAG: transcriptional regulator [Kiritimatiellae bacterium]|nr:transcriptional regulator [Kiritimatiellia bacterium]
MRRRRHKLDGEALRQIVKMLTEIDSEREMTSLLEVLFTPTEISDLALRWRLLAMLSAGVPQREIARRLRVSLCKITRGSKILKSDSVALSRLKDSFGASE